MGWQGRPITPPGARRVEPMASSDPHPELDASGYPVPIAITPAQRAAFEDYEAARERHTLTRDGAPPAFDLEVGWEAYEVCPIEHQGDTDRRGGVVIGHSETHVVVLRHRKRGKFTELRQQAIPIDSLDLARILPPDRATCHRTARIIAGAIGGGRGQLDDEDVMWLGIARQLAEVR